jgi:hypothetical protein
MGIKPRAMSRAPAATEAGVLVSFRPMNRAQLLFLKHHLNRHPVPEWVHQQVYLNPYPKELMLRNHV